MGQNENRDLSSNNSDSYDDFSLPSSLQHFPEQKALPVYTLALRQVHNQWRNFAQTNALNLYIDASRQSSQLTLYL